MTEKKFRKIYVQNQSFRVPVDKLEELCTELVYVCDGPMFDEYVDPEKFRRRYEHRIEARMKDFDPQLDAIGFYGDSAILVMMVMYLTMYHDSFTILRYSNKKEGYVERLMSANWFDMEPLDNV